MAGATERDGDSGTRGEHRVKRRWHLIAPCGECPFLREGGIRVRPDRAREIARTHIEEGGGAIFHCHKSVYTGRGRWRKADRLHCAGAILFALNNGVHTLAMQLGERLGLYELDQMTGHEHVFGSWEEMVDAHRIG